MSAPEQINLSRDASLYSAPRGTICDVTAAPANSTASHFHIRTGLVERGKACHADHCVVNQAHEGQSADKCLRLSASRLRIALGMAA